VKSLDAVRCSAAALLKGGIMKKKLQEVIERLDRIEQTVNLVFGAGKGREQMRAGDYAEDPFANCPISEMVICSCGTSARCYKHFPHGSMTHDTYYSVTLPTKGWTTETVSG